MTISEVDCQIMLNEWQEKYIGNHKVYPKFLGFAKLGDKTRGITYFKGGNVYYNGRRDSS